MDQRNADFFGVVAIASYYFSLHFHCGLFALILFFFLNWAFTSNLRFTNTVHIFEQYF